MYVDAHCHLDDPCFDADRAEVLARARAAGISGFVLAAVGPETWPRQRALASAEPGVAYTIGLHPCWVAAAPEAGLSGAFRALAEALCAHPRPVAVGETGLDTRFAPRASLDAQLRIFRKSLALAREADLPVMLHLNGPGTHGRTLALLAADGAPRAGGVVHAYSGSADLVRDYVAQGLHISFAGTVCRAEARKVHAAARAVPGERLLVETDAPDLMPPGFAAAAAPRNEPLALLRVAAALAALRGETAEAVLSRSASACQTLFGGGLIRAVQDSKQNAPTP